MTAVEFEDKIVKDANTGCRRCPSAYSTTPMTTTTTTVETIDDRRSVWERFCWNL